MILYDIIYYIWLNFNYTVENAMITNCADKLRPVENKLKSFIFSKYFTITLFALGTFFAFIGAEVFGTLVFALIITMTFALTDDFIPVLEGIMFVTCFAIRCKNSFDDFIKFWWMAPPIVIFFLLHFFRYKVKFAKGKCFGGILAASIATTIGGLGSLSLKEYFSPTSLFFVFLLGFGMLLIYMYLSATLKIRDEYVFSQRIAFMMTAIILFLFVCVFEEYFSRRAEFLANPDVLAFQWRNNASTILMLAMPFPFMLSVKKFPYFFVGILSYITILCTGSRGGMIFGLVELVICIVFTLVVDKPHRKHIFAFLGVAAGCALIAIKPIIDMLSYTLGRLVDFNENTIRLQLIERGWGDFKSNVLFGRGLGYMGNSDVHNNAKFTLCWYHCSPIQIIGSFGLVGVAAYGYLIINRIKVLKENVSLFNLFVFISYIGLELMSLVNPGIFCPFPYLFLITLYMVAIEKCTPDNERTTLKKIIKHQ